MAVKIIDKIEVYYQFWVHQAKFEVTVGAYNQENIFFSFFLIFFFVDTSLNLK